MRADFPLDELQRLFGYDPSTGVIHYRVRRGRRAAGDPAGSPNSDGYLQLDVRHRKIKAHRAAWALQTGAWPVTPIDHMNGDRSDNRWANLRLASAAENARNMTGRNRHGFKGVVARRKRYRAVIVVDGRHHWLGTFNTPEEAGAAYDRAAQQHFGTFAKLNGAPK